ncbi:hypothetical protein BASA61_002973 [Batrachochytrium salamandrivorans]|nr:hypothetical protein BASA61_002973 [Batrachochytrium salamandrivorans]
MGQLDETGTLAGGDRVLIDNAQGDSMHSNHELHPTPSESNTTVLATTATATTPESVTSSVTTSAARNARLRLMERQQHARETAVTTDPTHAIPLEQPALVQQEIPQEAAVIQQPSVVTLQPLTAQTAATSSAFDAPKLPNASSLAMTSDAVDPSSNASLARNIVVGVLLAGSAFGAMILLLKRLWLDPLLAFLPMYKPHLAQRSAALSAFMVRLTALLRLYSAGEAERSKLHSLESTPSSTFTDPPQQTVCETLRTSIETSVAHISRTHALLKRLVAHRTGTSLPAADGEDIENNVKPLHDRDQVSSSSVSTRLSTVVQTASDVAMLLSAQLYSGSSDKYGYYPHMGYSGNRIGVGGIVGGRGRDAKVEQIKSEIRGLKGMLISRRNFPVAQ